MTYTIYELKLKPLSWWITDLTADTIFWHLCWQIKYEFWDDVLKEFLEEMEKDPIFVLSDVIFQNNFPKPLVDEIFIKNEKITEDFYNRNKDFMKDNKILAKYFRKILKSENFWKDILKIKEQYVKNKSKIEEDILNKNVIDRNSFTTWDNWIYSQSEKKSNYSCSLYIKVFDEAKLEKYDIKKLLKKIFFETWFGKKKSTWKWVFDLVEDWKERKDLVKENWNNILLLSNFIPSKNDPINWNYKLMTKFPKLWEEFSLEWLNFYKKPLVMIQSGAIFEKNKNYKWYVWRMIKDVDFQNKWIYHYAYWFTLEF